MRFGGHQTFHLRDSWLFKGINLLKTEGDIFSSTEKAMASLGVGSNMVASIRFWLEAVGFIDLESKKGLKLSSLANQLSKFDPYFERIGTSWLIHYNLASNEKYASTWFWFFNKFGVTEFSIESAHQFLGKYISSAGRKVNENTLGRDVNTFIRTYLASEAEKNDNPENSYTSPLAKLHLLERIDSGYRFNKPTIDSIPIQIYGAILIEFWQRIDEPSEFRFEEMQSKDCSPGKVLNLDQDTNLEFLNRLVEQYPKLFSYKKSGGFFSVKVKSADTQTLLKDYYGDLHA